MTNNRTEPLIYIVDDDDDMRCAMGTLVATFGYRAFAFARPADFLAKHDPEQHGCVVLNVLMPEMSGLEVQQQLNTRSAMVPVIFVSNYGDIPAAVQAMKGGAFDFLEKPFRDQVLLDRIHGALKFDMANRTLMETRADLRRREASLTPREREVMALIVDGHANKIMAIDLGLSERTIQIHRSHVMEKMDARKLAHLVRMSMQLAKTAKPLHET